MAKEKVGPVDVKALWRRHEKLSAEAKELTDRLAPINKDLGLIEAQLFATIKEGQAKDGVQHVVRLGKSVSWAKVYADIKEHKLIPSTKIPEVEVIIENNSKETKSHKLEAAE
jgi:hypothetical protein